MLPTYIPECTDREKDERSCGKMEEYREYKVHTPTNKTYRVKAKGNLNAIRIVSHKLRKVYPKHTISEIASMLTSNVIDPKSKGHRPKGSLQKFFLPNNLK